MASKVTMTIRLSHHRARALFATILLFFGALAGPSSLAAQAKPNAVAQFSHWHLFVEGTGELLHCYILAEPRRSTPDVRRGDVFMSVANRPGQGVKHEISVRIGYPFGEKSKPYAKVAADTFLFFSGASIKSSAVHWAWLQDTNRTAALIRAMKRGNELVYRGTSARGTLTTDYYGLKGFTAALKALDTRCPT